jgi:hypothetical protein
LTFQVPTEIRKHTREEINMNINDLRLKYELSQSTRLDLYTVQQKAITHLREDKYRITQQTDEHIMFDNSGPPTFEMRGASASKLQDGIIELSEQGENTLKLTYFVSYKFVILALAAILIIAYLYNIMVLVLAPFLIITFCIELVRQKDNAKELLARILDAKNSFEISDKKAK